MVERSEYTKMRRKLETEIANFRKQILLREKLLQDLDALEDRTSTGLLAKEQPVTAISTLGLTDAVREIFRRADRQFSATDVREQLLAAGFQPHPGSNFLVMIHSTLARLREASEIKRDTSAGKRVYTAGRALRTDTTGKHGLLVAPAPSSFKGEDQMPLPSVSSQRNTLTRREKVELIVKLRSEGKTNKEIANTIWNGDTHALQCFLTPLIKRGLLERREPGRRGRNTPPAAGENL
jgi:hypothetical protein